MSKKNINEINAVPDVSDLPEITVTCVRTHAYTGYIGEPGISGTSQENRHSQVLALDLGTTTGWAMRLADGSIVSGIMEFRPSRYEGGGMRFLRFRSWLDHLLDSSKGIAQVCFEEVRRHAGTDAAHIYGGFLAHLSAWCELNRIPYQGVPVGTIKRHATGKGNAGKDLVVAAMRAKGFNPEDDNEADALAILTWVIDTQGGVR